MSKLKSPRQMLILLLLIFAQGAFAATSTLEQETEFLKELEVKFATTENATIQQHIKLLSELEAEAATPEALARIYLLQSGVIGLSAKKNKSAKDGKAAFQRLEKALAVAPQDPVVVQSYAESVYQMSNQSGVARYFIQLSMGINLQDCRSRAIEHLKAIRGVDAIDKLLEKLEVTSI